MTSLNAKIAVVSGWRSSSRSAARRPPSAVGSSCTVHESSSPSSCSAATARNVACRASAVFQAGVPSISPRRRCPSPTRCSTAWRVPRVRSTFSAGIPGGGVQRLTSTSGRCSATASSRSSGTWSRNATIPSTEWEIRASSAASSPGPFHGVGSTIVWWPMVRAASSTAWATWAKNGFVRSFTASPIVSVRRVTRLRASRLGR